MAITNSWNKTLVCIAAGTLLTAGIAGYGLYTALPKKSVTKTTGDLTVTYSEYRATLTRDRRCEIEFTKSDTDISRLIDKDCDDTVDSVLAIMHYSYGKDETYEIKNTYEIKKNKENEYDFRPLDRTYANLKTMLEDQETKAER